MTIDLDATDVEVYGSAKRGAARNHSGQLAYCPFAAFWAERGRCLASELHPGNMGRLPSRDSAAIAASSGKRIRYRLDRGGNRQLNRAIHCIAVSQGHCYPPAREFLARKQAEGKSRREALRCLKRHLARRVWRLLVESEIGRSTTTVDSQRGSLSPQIAEAA